LSTKASSQSTASSVAVYGLSTEGYRVASSIALKGSKVSLIDESARMAITLKPDIARTYPDVSSLIEDEPLLTLEPIDVAINKAAYIFFSPRIRKVGQEVKSDVSSKFKDATKALRPGASIIFTLPTGIGGNNENIALIEHITGLSVGKDIFYYYMPINAPLNVGHETLIGSLKSKHDTYLSKMLHGSDLLGKLNFVDIASAELVHSINILEHYSGMAGVLEICKNAHDATVSSELTHSSFSNIFLDDVAGGLYDLRIIGSSLGGVGPLMYLVNGTVKGTEAYIKHLIDRIRDMLKKRDLKASRTRVVIAWSLDSNEMRGDRMDLMSSLQTRLKDYIGDVDISKGSILDMYPTDKTTVIIACSKKDLMKMGTRGKQNSDHIVVKANPLCEISNL
jgi:hypothetical protein